MSYCDALSICTGAGFPLNLMYDFLKGEHLGIEAHLGTNAIFIFPFDKVDDEKKYSFFN